MTRNPHLHPEPRVDRNGNMVTRWVNAFKRREETKPIPAPALSVPMEEVPEEPKPYYDTLNRYMDEFCSTRSGLYDYDDTPNKQPIDFDEVRRLQKELEAAASKVRMEHFPEKKEPYLGKSEDYQWDERPRSAFAMDGNISFLIRRAPEMLTKVIESASKGAEENKRWVELLSRKELFPTSAFETDGSIGYFLSRYQQEIGAITFTRRLREEGLKLEREGHPVKAVEYTGIIDRMCKDSTVDNYPSEGTIEAMAVFAYIRGYHEEWSVFDLEEKEDIRYQTHKADVDYIAENLSNVYRILPELSRRRVTDAALIQTIIESPAAALNDGAL